MPVLAEIMFAIPEKLQVHARLTAHHLITVETIFAIQVRQRLPVYLIAELRLLPVIAGTMFAVLMKLLLPVCQTAEAPSQLPGAEIMSATRAKLRVLVRLTAERQPQLITAETAHAIAAKLAKPVLRTAACRPASVIAGTALAVLLKIQITAPWTAARLCPLLQHLKNSLPDYGFYSKSFFLSENNRKIASLKRLFFLECFL